MAINIITRSLSPRKQEVEISHEDISFRRHVVVTCNWPTLSVTHVCNDEVRERIFLEYLYDKSDSRWNIIVDIIRLVGTNCELSRASAERLLENLVERFEWELG